MSARFPQSTTSVAYRIKPAWASKIHVLYWAADADKLHRLRSGDTATTILTRSASGCTFDATNGVIAGTNTTGYFTDSIEGGYGALQENSNFTFGAGFYGDTYNSVSDHTLIGSVPPPDTFSNGFRIRPGSYTTTFNVAGGSGNDISGASSDDVDDFVTIAVRHDQADATADLRPWLNGSESTGDRLTSATPSSTSKLGDTARPLYIGGSFTGTGNTKVHFEFAFLAGVLTDADMATITSDPASIIEVAGASITLTPDPATAVVGGTRTFTINRTVAAPAGGVTYNLLSSNTGVATVPATATILEGNTSITFNATGVSAGSATITATNAADSGETDSVVLTVSAVKGLSITTGQTSLSGLTFAWFDEASPDLFGAPSVVGTTESTDGSGVLSITLTGTSLGVGDTGWLLVYKAGATAPDDIAFFGRLVVQDIG